MDMDLDEVALSWSCNSIAMLTRREASTPRRSRGVLVLPTSQLCRRGNGGVTECNFSAMLTRREASVLVLLSSLHCRGVFGGDRRVQS